MLPKMNQNDEFGMEREIINAKAYLYSAKNSQGQNLYMICNSFIFIKKLQYFFVVII